MPVFFHSRGVQLTVAAKMLTPKLNKGLRGVLSLFIAIVRFFSCVVILGHFSVLLLARYWDVHAEVEIDC